MNTFPNNNLLVINSKNVFMSSKKQIHGHGFNNSFNDGHNMVYKNFVLIIIIILWNSKDWTEVKLEHCITCVLTIHCLFVWHWLEWISQVDAA